MSGSSRQPTERGRVILDRLRELSLSIAEVERRTPLTKNTIANVIYGPRSPQRKTVELLAEALELPVEALTRVPQSAGGSRRGSSFGAWLVDGGHKALWIGVIGSLATAFFLWRGLGEQAISPAVQATQFVVILLLLTLLPRYWVEPGAGEGVSHALRVASKAARDFRRYWGLAWLFWVFLYFALTIVTWLGLFGAADSSPSGAARWAPLVLNLLQNSGTVLLFLCYEVVARPTIKDDLRRKQVLPTEAWFAFVALLTVAEGIVVWTGPAGYQPWFGWASGFGQGMALALLVGRFDSKYVEPPAVTVGLLYLYAVIQGAWPVFRTEEDLMLILTFAALVLKCLLFLFVSWLFESRILLFYLGRMRELDRSVRQEREEFLRRH